MVTVIVIYLIMIGVKQILEQTINKLHFRKFLIEMNLKDCHNFKDFRKLAKKKLPSPIFHYIDGAADDEVTYARNTSALMM